MTFEELRNKYKKFIYHDFVVNEDNNRIEIIYDFEIVGLSRFNPKWVIDKPDKKIYKDLKAFKECAFSLGMVELISYWKLCCPQDVYIKPAFLDNYQISWWKKLYYHGLGEFFYINNINIDIDSFMEIKSSDNQIDGDSDTGGYKGNLIPVGGGKDSFVTLELLKDSFDSNHTFIINKVKSAIDASNSAGYSGKLINVTRTLDKNMLDLNKKGFLNGHTPFSALVAFSSFLVSIIFKKKYIVLSNEASANESTVLNEEINHQYSKSYEFEKDFNEYTSKYLLSDIKYFSLLRALSELEISSIFSKLKKYHKVFRSCNVGSKEGIWCNHCAKCLFVYVMLSAYLTDEELLEIFNSNLLEDETLYELLEELCGLKQNKPFECVGTREEVNAAISKAIKLRSNIPLLYEKYLNTNPILTDVKVFDYFNNENFIPKEYSELLKNKIEAYKNE